MYKLSIWQNDEKSVEEFDDEDELRERVDDCLNDIDKKAIKTFTVSWISQGSYVKPWWEKK